MNVIDPEPGTLVEDKNEEVTKQVDQIDAPGHEEVLDLLSKMQQIFFNKISSKNIQEEEVDILSVISNLNIMK